MSYTDRVVNEIRLVVSQHYLADFKDKQTSNSRDFQTVYSSTVTIWVVIMWNKMTNTQNKNWLHFVSEKLWKGQETGWVRGEERKLNETNSTLAMNAGNKEIQFWNGLRDPTICRNLNCLIMWDIKFQISFHNSRTNQRMDGSKLMSLWHQLSLLAWCWKHEVQQWSEPDVVANGQTYRSAELCSVASWTFCN